MSDDSRAQASSNANSVKAARQELEITRTRIMKETCAVFESTERIWQSMDAGSTSRSLGFQQLIDNRDRLILLSRKDCEIYFELLKLEESA